MTTPIALVALFAKQTAAQILDVGLDVAQGVGLPVTTWRAGDPTRSYYKYLARVLESLEQQNSDFISAGFLRFASGPWLRVQAEDQFGVKPADPTFATPTVTITNTGTKRYQLDPGDLVAKCTASGKTYHSTIGGTWTAGTTLPITFTADEEGSTSSVGTDDVDALVTTFLGLTITGSTASIASDGDDDDTIKQSCEDSRGSMSPNGPQDAYNYVVKNSALTGNSEITRAETFDDSDSFDVVVYVAGNAGTVSAAAITAAQNAVEQWAAPLCVTPTVLDATPLPTPLQVGYSGDVLPPDFVAKGTAAWNSLVNTWRIGRKLTRSKIIQVLLDAVPEADNVVLNEPAADIVPTNDQVITVSTIDIEEE